MRRQVIGVSTAEIARRWWPQRSRGSGAVHALVLHAAVGMDEVSPSGSTRVWEVRDGRVTTWDDRARRASASSATTSDGLAGGEPAENAARLERLLAGKGGRSERCAVLLNAAAALYVSGNGWTLEESVARAREALESGAGADALARLRRAAPGPRSLRREAAP